MTAGDKGAAPPQGLDGTGLRIGVVRARWNAHIVERLAQGVGRGLAALGVDPADVVDEAVPGSFELPMGARILAASGRVDAVICLGCVIRGETSHYELVAGEAAAGIQQVQLSTGVPVAFGILTTEDEAQALARSEGPDGHNVGEDAAVVAVEMARLAERHRALKLTRLDYVPATKPRGRSLLLRRATAIAMCTLLGLAACSSDDDGGEDAEPEDTTSTTQVPEPLQIVLTNDDGIGGVGIDVLADALSEINDVEVTIVAPAEDVTGSSDKTTPGSLTYADGETVNGLTGTAVEGFPADTITVALDELGLEPDLVVSGINKGQNVGPLAYLSGTVGAGREAVRRGIPALAVSAGLTDDTLEDFDLAARLAVQYIEEHRDEIAAGTFQTDAVVNLNVPDCTAGSAKALVEVDLATEIPEGVNVFATDCAAASDDPPADDVLAVAAGFPAIALVPPEAPTG